MELHKEFDQNLNMWRIWVDEGYWITTYTDGTPIAEYVDYKNAFCPQNTDFTNHRVITDAMHNQYEMCQRTQNEPYVPSASVVNGYSDDTDLLPSEENLIIKG